MNRNITLIISLCFSLFFTKSKAAYIAGGEILYRNIGGLKYEITVKIYRDCQGASLDTIHAEIKAGSSLVKSLKLKLLSIKDVTSHCDKISNPCGKANTKNAGFGIEEFIFKDTVDFNSANDSVFKKYCLINIGAGRGSSYRSSGITTGGKSSNFWITSSFDICIAQQNISPEFFNPPLLYLCNNQAQKLIETAYDPDLDSISYLLNEPLINWNNKMSWDYGFSYKEPITSYFPTGYDKSKGARPDANPPIGFTYINEVSFFIFLPIKLNEITPISIKVLEWRKNKKGVYEKIGEINRESIYSIIDCSTNNIPYFNINPYIFDVCEGDNICFQIEPGDITYSPPPPAKTIYDTTKLTWSNPIKGSKLFITDSTSRLRKAKFCWTPPLGSSSDIPYSFNLKVSDNFCNLSGIATKTFYIKVKKLSSAKIKITKIKDGFFTVNAEPDSNFKGSSIYFWEVTDSIFNPSLDHEFTSNNSSYSNKKTDTLIFSKSGKYFINFIIKNPPMNCPRFYIDTIFVTGAKPHLFISPPNPAEKYVCLNTVDSIFPIMQNAVYPVKFKWSTSANDTLSYLKLKIVKDTTIRVDVWDSDQFHRWVSWEYKLLQNPNVSISGGDSAIICKNSNLYLNANATNYTDTVFWRWYLNGNFISDSRRIYAYEPGVYKLEIFDSNNCQKAYDSIKIINPIVNVFAGQDAYICEGDSFTFSATGLDTTNKKTGKYYWYSQTLSSSPISTLNTVKFLSSKYGFLIVKLMQTQGTLTCSATDTVNYFYLDNPQVSLKDTAACQNQQEINLMNLIKKPIFYEKGKINWFISSTLKNPKGNPIKTNDIIYNSDAGILNKYFMKIGKDKIELGIKNSDFINLKFSYIDTFGCRSKISDSVKVTIRKNYEIEFTNPEIKICHGDSIKYISDAAGVNLYGGKWFTNNDSANYNKWYQGNNYPMSEKIKTNALDANGGKYLLKYIIENNNCVSEKNEILNIYAFPQISWSQTESGDSVIFYDNSKYSIGRIWMIKSKVIGKDKIVKISKSEAKSNTILLKVYNELMCEVDSVIKPIITWGVSGIRKNDKFKIYPNPAQNALFVKSIESKIFRYEIYNELSQKIAENKSTLEITEIDIKKLIPGIYSIVIFTEGKNFSGRFIKNQ